MNGKPSCIDDPNSEISKKYIIYCKKFKNSIKN